MRVYIYKGFNACLSIPIHYQKSWFYAVKFIVSTWTSGRELWQSQPHVSREAGQVASAQACLERWCLTSFCWWRLCCLMPPELFIFKNSCKCRLRCETLSLKGLTAILRLWDLCFGQFQRFLMTYVRLSSQMVNIGGLVTSNVSDRKPLSPGPLHWYKLINNWL